ncbi:MAG: glycosyltransferase involved in cell wall biosynthesis [Candidatus Nitrosomirales archaeon]|jgi:glycosyltransferase involved in cell wall biosynthesis
MLHTISRIPNKIAVIDKCQGINWYSWKLCEEISELLGQEGKLLYYVPKRCAVQGQPGHTELKKIWSPYLYPLQLLRQLIKDRPEIVHIQYEFNTFGSLYSSFLVLPLLIFVKALGIKSVVTLHGPVFKLDSSRETMRYLLPPRSIVPASLVVFYMITMYRLISNLSEKIITHSNFFKRVMIHEYKIDESKVAVIPHGISSGYQQCIDSSSVSDKKIILYFGYIAPRKGLEDLISAYKQIQNICPDYLLVIAGAEPSYYKGYADQIKSLVSESDRIIFTGFVNDKELGSLISKAEAVVLPYTISISASGPLTLAIECGKPIVATRTEFFDETLSDGYDAILAQPGNSADLEQKLLQIINDRDCRLRLSRNIKHKAEKFSWKKIAELTINMYARVSKHTNKHSETHLNTPLYHTESE